jgi:hypothetical protein
MVLWELLARGGKTLKLFVPGGCVYSVSFVVGA